MRRAIHISIRVTYPVKRKKEKNEAPLAWGEGSGYKSTDIRVSQSHVLLTGILYNIFCITHTCLDMWRYGKKL